MKDLIELLGHDNTEVRRGTMSAILQYTPDRESRLMFVETNLMHFLRKYLYIPQLTTLCLSTLIHFAVEVEYLP